MAERIRALVEPSLLVWARKSASLSIEEVAKAVGQPPEKIEAWENGEDGPSIPQLKKIANACKRPVSVFFLPEPPSDFMPLRDFRRLALVGEQRMSPKLAYEIRAAQERRLWALEIAERLGEEPQTFAIRANVKDNAETVGQRIRALLGVTLAEQSRWGDPAKAFRAWRDAIERAGVLVFALSGAHHRISLNEMRGLAIAEREFPVIVVNGKDRSNGRIFTLLHELAHIALGLSAIENEIEPGDALPARDRAIERFCNQVAAAVLMPRASMLEERILIAQRESKEPWSDAQIAALANRYSVSREAMLIRLAELGRVDAGFVQAKRRLYARAAEELQEEEETGGFAPYTTQVVSHLGRSFARLVLQGYHSHHLTLSAASGYLGTQAKFVPKIERLAFNGAA